MSVRSQLSTHVLDSVTGRPAAGVAVVLHGADHPDGSGGSDGGAGRGAGTGWRVLASGVTDADGRLADLGPAELTPGRYRVVFDTGGYFARTQTPTLYPEVIVSLDLAAPVPGSGPGAEPTHVHVPLLLSPFAYSTYRGS